MKFSCSRKKLSDTLRIISRAVASKTDTQILSGIYIETKTDSLCLQTTDNRIGFSFHIPAEIEENGKIVILAKYFIEIVNNLPDDTVDFTYNDETKTAKITSGNANFALLTMNPDDFPVIKPIEDGTNFEINSEIMLQLIRKTSFACASTPAVYGLQPRSKQRYPYNGGDKHPPAGDKKSQNRQPAQQNKHHHSRQIPERFYTNRFGGKAAKNYHKLHRIENRFLL